MIPVLVPTMLFFAVPSFPAFDSVGWKHFRQILIPDALPEGPVVIPLESSIIRKCRADLSDLRVVSSTGAEVGLRVQGIEPPLEPAPFPAKIYRVAKRPGAWTDVWVDKSAKILTRGIVLQTGNSDFVRKVELRGSDNARELYVIKMDGLVADLVGLAPLRSLDILHPVNNFQYVCVRVLDAGQTPLKIDSVLCVPPSPAPVLTSPLSTRVLENRIVTADHSTVLLVDLGEGHHPVSGVTLYSDAKEFVKRVTIRGGASSSTESWTTIFEGTIFRIRKEEVVKENLTAGFKPDHSRFLRVEISGPGGSPMRVDRIEAVGTIPCVAFDYRRGDGYLLYYNNSTAKAFSENLKLSDISVQATAALSAGIKLGNEEINVQEAKPKEQDEPIPETKPHAVWRLVGAIIVLSTLLVLFSFMLGSRWLRRNQRRSRSRIFDLR